MMEQDREAIIMLRGFFFIIGLAMTGFGAIGLTMTVQHLMSGSFLASLKTLDPNMIMFIGVSDIIGVLGLLVIQATWPTVAAKVQKAADSGHPFIPRIGGRPLIAVAVAETVAAREEGRPPRPSRFWRGLGFVLGLLLFLPGLGALAYAGFGLADGTLFRDLSGPDGQPLAIVLGVLLAVGLTGLLLIRWGWRGWRAAGQP
jgi:hypothetical protein